MMQHVLGLGRTKYKTNTKIQTKKTKIIRKANTCVPGSFWLYYWFVFYLYFCIFIYVAESSNCDDSLTQATGPLTQAAGLPQSDAGVGIGILRGLGG